MKNKEMNKAEIKERLLTYRHFAWRIMVYLKAQPEVLSENNNQEVFRCSKRNTDKASVEGNSKIYQRGCVGVCRFYV